MQMLDAARRVESGLQPRPELTPEARQIKRWVLLGKRFNRAVTVMKGNGSEVAAQLVEDHHNTTDPRKRARTDPDILGTPVD